MKKRIALVWLAVLTGCTAQQLTAFGVPGLQGYVRAEQQSNLEAEQAAQEKQEAAAVREQAAYWQAFSSENPARAASLLAIVRQAEMVKICTEYTQKEAALSDSSPSSCGQPPTIPASDLPLPKYPPPMGIIMDAQMQAFQSDWVSSYQKFLAMESRVMSSQFACQWDPALPSDFEAQALTARGCTPADIGLLPADGN